MMSLKALIFFFALPDFLFTCFPSFVELKSPPESHSSCCLSHIAAQEYFLTSHNSIPVTMRATALVPMACAIVGFVLSMLCLFAGHKPGFMEDYHIITVCFHTPH